MYIYFSTTFQPFNVQTTEENMLKVFEHDNFSKKIQYYTRRTVKLVMGSLLIILVVIKSTLGDMGIEPQVFVGYEVGWATESVQML
jgi:hypothetical protein